MTRDVQTGNFADLVQFKIDRHFVDFRQVKIDSNCSSLLNYGQVTVIYFGQDVRPRKAIQTLTI